MTKPTAVILLHDVRELTKVMPDGITKFYRRWTRGEHHIEQPEQWVEKINRNYGKEVARVK